MLVGDLLDMLKIRILDPVSPSVFLGLNLVFVMLAALITLIMSVLTVLALASLFRCRTEMPSNTSAIRLHACFYSCASPSLIGRMILILILFAIG